MLGAGNRLQLAFGAATLGRLALGGDLAITTTGDWSVAAGQVIAVPRDLSLTVAGALTNAGTIGANRVLGLSAASLVNAAGGVIKGDLLTHVAVPVLLRA